MRNPHLSYREKTSNVSLSKIPMSKIQSQTFPKSSWLEIIPFPQTPQRRHEKQYSPRGRPSSLAHLLLSPRFPSPPPSLMTVAMASSRIAKPSRISSSEITSGGTNRSVLVPHVMTSSPRSRAAVTIGPGSRVSCNPKINPRPRTSEISSGNRCCSAWNPCRKTPSFCNTACWSEGSDKRENM